MTTDIDKMRLLYYVLILASAICTMTSYFVALHYCCQSPTTRNPPPHAVPVDVSFSLQNITKDKDTEENDDENELDKNLKKSSKGTNILAINLRRVKSKTDENAMGKNLIYTLERFPDGLNKAKSSTRKHKPDLKHQEVGKPKSDKFRGFYFSFSFTGDQLSAATRRLFNLNALATYGMRLVVEPLVQDSLFFGDQLVRKQPRLKPLSLYYDMKSVNELLEDYGYAKFASRLKFLGSCRRRTGSLYVRLLPNAWIQSQIKLKPEVKSLIKQTVKEGWMRCDLPLIHLRDYLFMRELRVVRQICVNTDTVRNFFKLENEVFQRYKCVVFHHWSGTGQNNGNYFTPSGTRLPPLELTHLLPFSSEILGKARRFVREYLGDRPYISVHIRAERFFRTNPNFTENFLRFQMCSELMVKTVNSLKNLWQIDQIFFASDVGERGSNAIAPVVERVSKIESAIVEKLVKDLVKYQDNLIQQLEPVLRQTPGGVDQGVQALVDMSILKDGDHVITVGTGLTWQLWLIDLFRQRQEEKRKVVYNVVKLC